MTHLARTSSVLWSAALMLAAARAYSADPASPSPTPAAAPEATTPQAPPSPAEPAGAAEPPSKAKIPDTPPPKSEALSTPARSNGSVPASPYEPSPPPTVDWSPPAAPPVAKDQPATLFSNVGEYAIGGFGGIGVMYTRFANTNAVLVCGEGAVLIDHALSFGAGGCGITTMVNAVNYGNPPHDPNDRMTFGYGGAIVRYHFLSRELFNLGVGAMIGAGGLSIGTWTGTGSDGQQNYTNRRGEAVFLFEPQVGGYLNLTRWMRVGISGGYRIVSGVSTPGLSFTDVGGPSLGSQIQLGWF